MRLIILCICMSMGGGCWISMERLFFFGVLYLSVVLGHSFVFDMLQVQQGLFSLGNILYGRLMGKQTLTLHIYPLKYNG